jgi:hypothetical protein
MAGPPTPPAAPEPRSSSEPGAPPAEEARSRARVLARRRNNLRRAVLAISAVALAEIVGAVGFHVLEGANWINAFYFESMLATGQGPPFTLTTDAGKVFASVMAFVSVGSSLTAVLFVLGPLLGRLWRRFVEDVEHDVRDLEVRFREEREHP